MTDAAPPPFDLAGPLPGPGVTVLEASAGTGKTYALTSLVARFVAAGTPLSDILAVTFTRMATGELRDRIRQRLVQVHAGAASGPGSGPDPVVQAVAEGDSAGVAARVTRLADAIADFDAATIATTHGFCQAVLRELGSAGDTALDTVLLEDPSDLVTEVVDDLYLRWALGRPALPFTPAVARRAAALAVQNPGTRVVPDSGSDPAGLLGRLALSARREVGRRLLDGRLLTYDDLLFRLAQTLSDPRRGPDACDRLRRRYQVVLVDEFQDTDPSQWEILRRAFGEGRSTLVLIGDPKQAIYGFRGADVHSYLDAAASADRRYTLADNWRADQPLLDAVDALLRPLQFGHAGIPYRTVRAAADRQGAGLHGHPHPSPLRFRVVPDRQAGVRITSRGQLQKGSLMEWLAADLAADVAGLLRSGAVLHDGPPPEGPPPEGPPPEGPPPGGAPRRPLAPGDVAVLTRTNRQALLVRDALRRAGVPSVVAGLDTVFASPAARDWLRLLEALQEPASRPRVAAVALSSFLGLGAVEVATADEGYWEEVHDRVHRWAAVLAGRGVAALYRAITVDQELPGRLLGREGGERLLTDLGHVAQLLHARAAAEQLSAPALRAWLSARVRAAASEQDEAEERSRRLESDAEAVQVLTIHRAKGLEFPVVYCPFLWDPGRPESRSAPVVFHDPAAGDARTLDVGRPGDDRSARSGYDGHADLARAERRGEDLRLLYVALTRARHQVVIWWAAAKDSRLSPLTRLLVCRDGLTGEVRGVPAREPSAGAVRKVLDRMAEAAPGLVSVEAPDGPAGAAAGAGEQARPSAGPDLASARFERALDERWRRASYSSITAGAHDGGRAGAVDSEPEDPVVSDEPPVAAGGAGGGTAGAEDGGAGRPATGLERPSPLMQLPGGTEVGTFVHRVMERIDFAAADLGAEVDAALSRAVQQGAPAGDLSSLPAGLMAVLTTPLGPLLPGLALSSVGRADRLDELSFELPVAGGDLPRGEVDTADIAGLLAAHLPVAGPGREPLAGYPRRLEDPVLATSLRGYLTGSLDLVFRVRGPEGTHRWFLADYKTNWLGAGGGRLSLGDYTPDALDHEMQRRHYPLQALLYLVALHRYLRWRQPGYRAERDLGGVLYLFLRGMGGPETPVVDGAPCGVFSWAPPGGLVEQLSELFSEGGQR
ncbi:MAG TPA: UvrD-helicase domain-containing protein [Acidimicrobiales bacterium]|nr:UvrD-helicase domain-containing protein [Acidimicrobiales bacterium]